MAFTTVYNDDVAQMVRILADAGRPLSAIASATGVSKSTCARMVAKERASDRPVMVTTSVEWKGR